MFDAMAGPTNDQTDLRKALGRLDALLLRAPRPTPFRGILQAMRANVMIAMRSEDGVPVRDAVEEAIRLLPNEAFPKIIGVWAHTFSSDPRRAADLWLLASRDDPQQAKEMDPQVIGTLIERLTTMGDVAKADKVWARMSEIGFELGGAMQRSAVAHAALVAAMKRKDVATARSLIPSIIVPGSFRQLLTDNRYRELWPAIIDWAGPRLSKQWPTYLGELQRNWESSHELEAAADYAAALSSVQRTPEIVESFLPYLAADRLDAEAPGLPFIAPIVARALVQIGRDDEAFALLRRLAQTPPIAGTAMALNYTANIGKLQLETGRYEAALTTIDQAIADAVKAGPDVNESALLAMHRVRVCAATRQGKLAIATDSLSRLSMAQDRAPSQYMLALICLERKDDVRALAMRLLNSETQRDFALELVQPVAPSAISTLEDRRMKSFYDGLRGDPVLLKAVSGVGRVLDFPGNVVSVAP